MPALRFKRADLRSFSLTAALLFALVVLFSPLKVSAPTHWGSYMDSLWIGVEDKIHISANYTAKLTDIEVISGENISFSIGGQTFLELKPVVAVRSATVSFRNVTEVVNASLPDVEGNETVILRRFVENVSYKYEEFSEKFSAVKKNYSVEKSKDKIKFAPIFTKLLKEAAENESIFIGFKITKGWENLTVGNQEIAHANGLILNLRDLTDRNFSVEIDKANRMILIGNLAGGYTEAKQQLTLDPTVQGSCGTLSSANTEYQMTQSLSSTGTCFTVAADNVTLDCQGFPIEYANASSGYGVSVTGYNTTVIKNCNFLKQNQNVQFSSAIYANLANNSIFLNNTINSTGNYSFGIQLTVSNFTNVTSNSLNISGNFSYGIGLGRSNRNNITQNIIRTGGGNEVYGVNLTTSSFNFLLGNNVTTNGTGTIGNNHGFNLIKSTGGNVINNNTVVTYGVGNNYGFNVQNANNNSLNNNTITTQGTSSGNMGISLNAASNNTITNNKINTFGINGNDYGIELVANAQKNVISNNTINAKGYSGSHGIFVSGSSNNVIFGNAISTNSTNDADASHGIYLSLSSNSNTVSYNAIIVNTTLSAGLAISTGNNNMIANNSLKVHSTGFGVQFVNLVTGNIFYNNIFNTTARHVNIADNLSLNNFSVSTYSGTNIIGGSLIGGNFYDNSTVGGQAAYSKTCADADANGICDLELNFSENSVNNTDFYPLAAATAVTDNNATLNVTLYTASWLNGTVNSTITVNASVLASGGAGHQVNGTVFFGQGNPTSQRINATQFGFPFYNTTQNFTCGFMASNARCDLNITINLTTIGAYWNLTINFTSNNSYVLQNGSSTFRLNISSVIPPAIDNNGTLNVTLYNGNINVTQNSTFSINASVICQNGNCHQINATPYFNWTGAISTRLNDTALAIPFFNVTGFQNQTCGFLNQDGNCSINWTINATGVGNYLWTVNFTSNNTYVLPNGSSIFRLNVSQTLTIDTTAPNISVEQPLQDAKVDPTFNIQFQVNDTVGVSQCNITSGVLGTISNGTVLNVSNGNENNHLNLSTLQPGDQVSFSVRCMDWVGNTATSPVRTFSIAEKAGTVSSGNSRVHGDVTTKKQCAAGEKPFSINQTNYCTPCTGTIEVVGGKAYCVEKADIVEAGLNPFQTLPNSKGATVLMLLVTAAYVLFGTNLLFKKKQKVNSNG